MNKLHYIFWGTEKFARDILKILIDNEYIPSAVVTAPDKAVGRKQIITAPPVKELALAHNIEVLQPDKIKGNTEFYEKIKNLAPDLSIVAQYGKILPLDILNLPKHKSINVHGSILPKYRGAAPVQFALLNGEKSTGVTLIQMDEKMDHGPILAMQELKIEATDTSASLLDKLAIVGGYLLINNIEDYINGDIDLLEQNHNNATFTQMISKEDALIDWSDSAKNIHNKLRAYNPWPGIYTFLEAKRLKILATEILEENHHYEKGQIIFRDKNLFIACGKNLLKINSLQLEGKNPMDATAFLSGYKKFENHIL